MKNDDLDKRLSAYLDGALADGRRERFERELDGDAALQKQLKRSRALSGLVREAWSEGPAAPASEFLIASIRPHLAVISRERRARPAWQQGFEHARMRLAGWFSPMTLATSAAAAFLLAVAILPRQDAAVSGLSASLPAYVPAPSASYGAAVQSSSSPVWPAQRQILSTPFAPVSTAQDRSADIYDVEPGESPAMLLQNEDGSTVLWLLEDDDLSQRLERMDRWS